VKLPLGQLDLLHRYVNQEGSKKQGVGQGDYTVVDAEGGVHQGTLDSEGIASVAGLPMGMATVSYGRDPRDPWDEGSYFGEGTEWPVVALSEAGADTATGSPEDAADKLGAVAQVAEQGASVVQSLKQGGAQALLAQAGQAAIAHVAGKLPGGAAAIGLPGSLPRIGPGAVISVLKKSFQ
jgi:type VI secretion system secreted protein VgrG